MRRRGLVTAAAIGVGLAGAAGGVWWRQRADTGPAELWSLQFDQPGGGRLALAGLRSRPLLVNFWATWCPPCITEMPLLDAFHRRQPAGGWQVVGLAIDQPAPVQAYLRRRPVQFAIGLAGLSGIDLSRRLGNAAGALPFSIAFNIGGRVVERRLGPVEPADLARWERLTA